MPAISQEDFQHAHTNANDVEAMVGDAFASRLRNAIDDLHGFISTLETDAHNAETPHQARMIEADVDSMSDVFRTFSELIQKLFLDTIDLRALAGNEWRHAFAILQMLRCVADGRCTQEDAQNWLGRESCWLNRYTEDYEKLRYPDPPPPPPITEDRPQRLVDLT